MWFISFAGLYTLKIDIVFKEWIDGIYVYKKLIHFLYSFVKQLYPNFFKKSQCGC